MTIISQNLTPNSNYNQNPKSVNVESKKINQNITSNSSQKTNKVNIINQNIKNSQNQIIEKNNFFPKQPQIQRSSQKLSSNQKINSKILNPKINVNEIQKSNIHNNIKPNNSNNIQKNNLI